MMLDRGRQENLVNAISIAFTVSALVLAPAIRAEDFQGSTHQLPYEEEIIQYSKREPHGPVAELQKKIDSGTLKLKYDGKFGYLPAVLEAFQVPKSSQMIVFSKTSLQRGRISPKTPRALYFNDDVYIGYIPGAPLMEVSAVDPQLGGVFYKLEQVELAKPTFERSADWVVNRQGKNVWIWKCFGCKRIAG